MADMRLRRAAALVSILPGFQTPPPRPACPHAECEAVLRPMVAFLTQLLFAFRSPLARRARLEAENLIMRQQLIVLRRKSPTRARLWNIDRLLLVWLYRLYPSLLDAIIIVQPETVLRWHRRGFRAYWRWKIPPCRSS